MLSCVELAQACIRGFAFPLRLECLLLESIVGGGSVPSCSCMLTYVTQAHIDEIFKALHFSQLFNEGVCLDVSFASRWEEEKKEDGVKWKFLEHKGPLFAPPYEPLPDHVKFIYDGKSLFLLNSFMY